MKDKAQEPTQETEKGLEIPVPSRKDFDAVVKKVAGPPEGHRPPDETDQPREQSD